MKAIYSPGIYKISESSLEKSELKKFLDEHDFPEMEDCDSDQERLTEVGGRTCYQSFTSGRKPSDHIKHIIKVGHGSVLEHSTWSFLFTGVSRSLTHELIRHRAGFAYSELSQRFVDCSKLGFVVPPLFIGNADLEHEWYQSCMESTKTYAKLLDKIDKAGNYSVKEKREAARSVLPACTETRILVTANARAWRHFLEMRGSRHADKEIRRLALNLLPILKDDAPNIFGDYSLVEYEIGSFEIFTENRKV